MSETERFENGVAVIGMSGVFPGAPTLAQYWKNLCDGVDSITRGTIMDNGRRFPFALGMIGDIDLFDASFFNFNPREAEVADPQTRIFLEQAWEALENAGYGTDENRGAVGVYAGKSAPRYGYRLYANRALMKYIGDVHAMLGSEKDFLATRVSYKLNLTGPSVVVQSACSTALVAVHLACQSLLNGECDLAVAGGVTLMRAEKQIALEADDPDGQEQVADSTGGEDGGVIAADGYCRAFDANAGGTVGAEGAGIVVLKRLNEALRDRDHIHAVIRGSAINNDGDRKFGFTAPSVEGQSRVISEALAVSGVRPDTVTYVETHGTGTPLGDPVEVAALVQSFQEHTDKKGFCAIGSVKTNIGHTDAAAGTAGLIKTILSLQHGMLPPSLHFETPSPEIDFENSPFFVNTKLTEWKRNGTPRRAGVSSFGIGGTNAHVIVEEAPPREESGKSRRHSLLVLSARTPTALKAASENLAAHLQANPGLNPADVAFTLQTGRKAFNWRYAQVCASQQEAIEQLQAPLPERPLNAFPSENALPVNLIFPGGEAHVGLGLSLYREESSFRKHMDAGCELAKKALALDLRPVLYPGPSGEATAQEQIGRPEVAAAALFVFEHALARTLIDWGVQPATVTGEGPGEFVAACIAGVIGPDEALQCAIARAVSGRSEGGRSLKCRTLARKLKPRPAACSWLSSASGLPIAEAEAAGARFWESRLSENTPSGEAIGPLLAGREGIFLSLGREGEFSRALSAATLGENRHLLFLPAIAGDGQSDDRELLKVLGQLWTAGVVVRWDRVYEEEKRCRLPLPAYPFERRSYWLQFDMKDPAKSAGQEPAVADLAEAAASGMHEDVSDWFYLSSWKRSVVPDPYPADTRFRYLIFVDFSGLGNRVADVLEKDGNKVVRVLRAADFVGQNEKSFRINPHEREHYEKVLTQMRHPHSRPLVILDFWNIAGPEAQNSDAERRQSGSMMFTAQALGRSMPKTPVYLAVISEELQNVSGSEQILPFSAAPSGLCGVISEEHPNIFCRTIDLEKAAAGSESAEKQFSLLMREIRAASPETHVAWRGGRRFEKAYNTLKVPAPRSAPRIRPAGVYLHTAPLSEGGLAMVRYLARHGKPKLALFLPEDFPERNKWNTLKALNNPREKSTRAVTQLLEMEAAGAEIMVVRAVMNDERQVREGVAAVIAKFGSIHGVIHGTGAVDRKASRQLCDIDAVFLGGRILGGISAVRALEESLKGQNPDFVFLCAPLAAGLAGSGMAAAAVLGRFINSLAEQKNLSGQTQWIAVNVESRTVESERCEEVMARLLTSIEGPAVFVSPEDFRGRLTTRAEVSEFAASGWADPNTPVPETEIAPEMPGPRSEAVPQAAANGHAEGAAAAGGTAQSDAANNDVLRPEGVVLPPAHPRPDLPVPFVAPSNETEQKIAVIWQDILRLREVGIKDNFFQLNGDSLLATQLMARLRKAFQIDLPLRYFFEYPTIEAMAKAVLTAAEKGIGSRRPAIARVSRGDRTRALQAPSPRLPRAIGAVNTAGDAVKNEETGVKSNA